MEGLILKSGTGFDNSELTCIPRYVKKGKTFLGFGSDAPQTGTLEEITKVEKRMSVNETYNIPEGLHGGNDYFYQETEKVEGPIVEPGAGEQILEVQGKILTSNTVVRDVENLSPGTIKFGVQIGDITGSFQGFVD